MFNPHDADMRASNGIEENIVRVNNQFPGVGNGTGSPHVRVPGQKLRFLAKQFIESQSGARISGFDIAVNDVSVR